MANSFIDSNATGAQDGSSVTDAWHSIETALAGTSYWGGGGGWGDTGGPVTGTGDIVWLADNHHEIWQAGGALRVLYSSSTDTSLPVIYRGDLAGTHFSTTGGRPQIELFGGSSNAYFDDNGSYHAVRFEDIDFYYSSSASMPTNFWNFTNGATTFVRCNFGGASGSGRHFTTRFWSGGGGHFIFEDCTFNTAGGDASTTYLMAMADGHLDMKRCTVRGWKWIMGGAYNNSTSSMYCEDLDLDERDATTGAVIYHSSGGANSNIKLVRTKPGDFTPLYTAANMENTRNKASMRLEVQDYDGDPRYWFKATYMGTIESVETPIRTGDVVYKMEPSVRCTPEANGEEGLQLCEMPVPAPAGVSRDYSIWVEATGWTTFPTADEFVFEVGYYDTASDHDRTWVSSTDVISANSTLTEIGVSGISPAEDGLVLLRVRLLTNDGGTGEEITVDMKPDIV